MEEEISPVFRSAFSQGPFPAPNGLSVACIQASRLVLQDVNTFEIKRTIQLSTDLASGTSFLKWSRNSTTKVEGLKAENEKGESEDKKISDFSSSASSSSSAPLRFLVADDQSIEIYDAEDPDWKAVLNPGFGGMKYVDFGGNEDEILVLSDFGLKVTVWSLKTSRHVDLQHPKVGFKGFGYRPMTNHFALLTRPAAHDILNLYSPLSYDLITSVVLPTADAQGLKWSPDGRWIAIWDSPSAGYRVVLYTADGHLFRTHEQPSVGLGLRSVEWSSGGEYLVLGGYDGRVIYLNNFLFNPVIEMRHTATLKSPTTDIWSEELSVQGERHYTLITPPVNLPTVESPASDPNPKIGVSMIAFSARSTLVATKDERMPTSVWIWSLETLSPIAILVQLSQVKAIQWHPSRDDLLTVICGADPNNVNTNNLPSVYLWSQQWDYPRTVKISRDLLAANLWLRWIDKKHDDKEQMILKEEDEEALDETTQIETTSDQPSKPIKFLIGDRERYQIIKLQEASPSVEEGEGMVVS